MAADLLALGVLGSSAKEDERRLPLHPRHLDRIDPDLRARIVLEAGYGERFDVTDAALADLVAVRPRAEVIASSDVLVLPKPQPSDLAEVRHGQVLWGWPHCVQDQEVTQFAVDKQLTLIAFEAMNHWKADGGFGLHVFHKNNELAGYSSVLHALQLRGLTGNYGRWLSAVVIGFGATARGAVTALRAQGVHNVQVLTNREVAAVGSPIPSVRILQLDHDDDPSQPRYVISEQGRVPLPPFLAESDIVVNCTLQDPLAPITYLHTEDLAAFEPGSIIVDVSCDEGMGFSWARATSFADPMFTVGNNVHYYAVDHSPSHLWESATWDISEAMLPFLRAVMEGPSGWGENPTIDRAIEIRSGHIRNPDVLVFQHRGAEYPHLVGAP